MWPNPPNTDLSKGFTVPQVTEKYGWTEPAVWSLALEGKMGLAEKIGAGRSTRYRFKGQGESLSNRKVEPANRKPWEKGEDR